MGTGVEILSICGGKGRDLVNLWCQGLRSCQSEVIGVEILSICGGKGQNSYQFCGDQVSETGQKF